jgi:25S rRNA (uracil2634-N3)-methyltransferase
MPPQKQTKPAPPPKPTIPFDVYDDILLVGEGPFLSQRSLKRLTQTSTGDFSFAASLATDHGATSLVATTLDDEASCHAKHPSAPAHTAAIAAAFDDDQQSERILYGVDATQLHKLKRLRNRTWTRIVFNFPHVGGRSTDVNRQARANQALLAGFFASAKQLLSPSSSATSDLADDVNGTAPLARATALVTLFEGEPYSLWNVRDLARHAGLVVLRSFRFPAEAYPAYRHARTLGVVLDARGEPSATAWRGEERAARMFEFGLKPAERHDTTKKKEQESSDED